MQKKSQIYGMDCDVNTHYSVYKFNATVRRTAKEGEPSTNTRTSVSFESLGKNRGKIKKKSDSYE